jgi:hypothetical protein
MLSMQKPNIEKQPKKQWVLNQLIYFFPENCAKRQKEKHMKVVEKFKVCRQSVSIHLN